MSTLRHALRIKYSIFVKMTKLLLKYGASTSTPDHDGLLPIHTACRCIALNAEEVVKLLLDHGVDVNARDR